ncbi:uncharacterized protein EDB91DRAFT_792179 [Suillus paluster]|uniref:uncharacterized protein n=1 Tax=Suillus paluster TaxID=48578 RepID=UPI001B86C40C|nr:uncharacterized protein EDB91DRAFT_792179 [Suillus paluster]KAG1717647.1 hypothetical protein EDB91DRAFT_792179 [Suillus paluster]
MFTSRSVIFALLIFLAGANACIQCPATVGGIKLSSSTVLNGGILSCKYLGKGRASKVECLFLSVSGNSIEADSRCPSSATIMKKKPPERGICPTQRDSTVDPKEQ